MWCFSPRFEWKETRTKAPSISSSFSLFALMFRVVVIVFCVAHYRSNGGHFSSSRPLSPSQSIMPSHASYVSISVPYRSFARLLVGRRPRENGKSIGSRLRAHMCVDLMQCLRLVARWRYESASEGDPVQNRRSTLIDKTIVVRFLFLSFFRPTRCVESGAFSVHPLIRINKSLAASTSLIGVPIVFVSKTSTISHDVSSVSTVWRSWTISTECNRCVFTPYHTSGW